MGEGNCESKLARDSGVSLFTARHLDVSQGPLREIWGEFRPLSRVPGLYNPLQSVLTDQREGKALQMKGEAEAETSD